MLDIIYLALTLALFALVSLAAAGIDRLGPRSRPTNRVTARTTPRPTTGTTAPRSLTEGMHR